MAITHLQLMDDTICFMRNLKLVLIIFETIMGLKVNLSKSSLEGIDVCNENLDSFADIMGCKVEH